MDRRPHRGTVLLDPLITGVAIAFLSYNDQLRTCTVHTRDRRRHAWHRLRIGDHRSRPAIRKNITEPFRPGGVSRQYKHSTGLQTRQYSDHRRDAVGKDDAHTIALR